MSFIVILIMWVNHHELLRMVQASTIRSCFSNGLLLLTVTSPFPTAVLAQNLATSEAKTAVAFYCATFVAAGRVLEPVVRDHGARRLVCARK